jgi:hypothetical protein
MNDDGTTLAEVSLTFIPLLTAAFAGFIGWLLGRGKERRDMRRQGYVSWLRAARNLVSPVPGTVPIPGTYSLPVPQRISELNDWTVELQVLGSKKVAEEANRFLRWVTGSQLSQQNERQLSDIPARG